MADAGAAWSRSGAATSRSRTIAATRWSATPPARIVAAWGDPEAVILPRSSCKMLQALPLVESGAADGLDVRAAGARLRLAPGRGDARDPGGALAGRPRARRDRPALRPAGARRRARARSGCARRGEAPCQLHNNCSGKHAGFLTLNRRLGGGAGIRRDRPSGAAGGARRLRGDVRRRRAPAGASTAARRRTSPPPSTASRWRWRAWPTRAGSGRRARRRRGGWSAAMIAHPLLVAGEGRACSELMAAMDGGRGQDRRRGGLRRHPARARPRRRAQDRGRRHPRLGMRRSPRSSSGSAPSPPTHPAAARRLDPPILSRRGFAAGRSARIRRFFAGGAAP